MNIVKTLVAALLLLTAQSCCCQSQSDSILEKIDPQKWSKSIEKRVSTLERKLVLKSQKTLNRLQRQEEKTYQKLLGTPDSVQAKLALSQIGDKYKTLQDKLKEQKVGNVHSLYLSKLDTIFTTLKFLDRHSSAKNVPGVLAKTEDLQNRFYQAEEIKKFIRERKQQLKEQLEKVGLVRELKKFNKQSYYYAEQISEYKALLKESTKAERKAFEMIQGTKLFKDFMRENSQFSSLFRVPGNSNNLASQTSLSGLQTQAQVNSRIQQQVISGGPNAAAQFQQNMRDAQGEMNRLKDRLNRWNVESTDSEMPEGFKPNKQRTKSFLKRLELGTNLQTQKSTNLFPVTSDIGISMGFKLNDNSRIGVGAAYKLGLGSGWNHIKLSNEGLGLRSFIDWRVKGSFWLTGGYEKNLMPAGNDVGQLTGSNKWRQSGLVGITKEAPVRAVLFKKTKLQLLWDFLSSQSVTRSRTIIFRIGYNF